MNRAEKRRQQKMAAKAAKRQTRHKPEGYTARNPQNLSNQQALDLAMQYHTDGDLPKAEGIYRKLLQADPNQPAPLHLLGLIAH